VLKGFYFTQGVIIILYSHTVYHCLKNAIPVSSMIDNCTHSLFTLHTPNATILRTMCIWLTIFYIKSRILFFPLPRYDTPQYQANVTAHVW